MKAKHPIIVSAALLLASLSTQAATLTFQNGASNDFVTNYSGTADTALASNTATRNGGGLDYMSVGRSLTRRAILSFDLSSLTGQVGTVTDASLTLYQNGNATTADLTIAVYQLTTANAGWSEGTGSFLGTANAGEVTWSHLDYSTQAWAGTSGAGTSGTDYIATPIATFAWRPTDTSVTFSLTPAMLNQWISNPAGNAGLLFVPLDGSGVNGITANFATSEYAMESLRPLLSLTYEPIPEPGTWALVAAGLALTGLLRGKRKP